MLKELLKVLKNSRSKETFFRRLSHFFTDGSDEYLMIQRAYADACEYYEPKIPRDKKSAQAYKRHIRGVVLIVLDYVKILERRRLPVPGYKIVVAAVLHGIVVNSNGRYGLEKLGRDYDPDIKHIVDYASLRLAEEFGGSKNAAKNRFKGRLLQDNVDVDVIVVLLADVLHNHIVGWPRLNGSVKGKIYETWNFYYPRAVSYGLLVYEIKNATNELQKEFTPCD